jgi:hypothetical protein
MCNAYGLHWTGRKGVGLRVQGVGNGIRIHR